LVDTPGLGKVSAPRKEVSRRGTIRWKRWLLALLAFVSLPGVALVLLNVASTVWVHSAQASVRAAGFAMRLEDLEPPPLAKEMNAAFLYAGAIGFDPDPNAMDEKLRRAKERGFTTLDDADKAHVRSVLTKFTQDFDLARRGRALSQCRYDAGYVQHPMRYSQFVEMAELLSLQAESEREAGRSGEAREATRDLSALADSHRAEPFLNSQGIRMRLVRIGLRTVDRCVTAETPGEELQAWLDLVPKPETFDGAFERWVRTELAIAAGWSGMGIRDALGSLG